MTTEIALFQKMVVTKVIYRCRTGRHFYGTENEIWAGFGPVGNTEKKRLGADYGLCQTWRNTGPVVGLF